METKYQRPSEFFFQNHKAAWKIRDQKCSSSIAAESLFYAMASPQLELAFCEDFASGKLHDPYTNRPRKHEKEPDQERWSCRFGNWIRSILLNGCWVKNNHVASKGLESSKWMFQVPGRDIRSSAVVTLGECGHMVYIITLLLSVQEISNRTHWTDPLTWAPNSSNNLLSHTKISTSIVAMDNPHRLQLSRGSVPR